MSSSPFVSPSPTPSSSPTPAPSPSPSPSAQALQNKEAQGQLIGDLTAAEAHALLLQRSVDQSQLNLIALGQQMLQGEQELARLNGQLDRVRAEQAETTSRLRADRQTLSGTVRRLYVHQGNFFAALIEAGGFGGFLHVIGYSNVLLDREQSMIRSVQADQVALEHARTTLERNRQQKQTLLDQLTVTRTAISQQIQVEQSLQTELQSTIDAALSALDATQADSPQMAAERARLVSLKTDSLLREIEQAVFAQDTLLSSSLVVPGDPNLESPGHLAWPVPHATITQGFGPTAYAFEAAYAGFAHFHTGIDLAMPLGTPVFAAADGVVQLAQPMADASGNLVGYGNYVVIQHSDMLKTLYGHLLSIQVKAGNVVKQGQLIGLLGSTGNSTGPHTHFEVRIDNSPVDPMTLLAESTAAAPSAAGPAP